MDFLGERTEGPRVALSMAKYAHCGDDVAVHDPTDCRLGGSRRRVPAQTSIVALPGDGCSLGRGPLSLFSFIAWANSSVSAWLRGRSYLLL